MTTESHELALCLINENSQKFPYAARVTFAQDQRHVRIPVSWAKLVARYARHYEREHGSPDDIGRIFTTEDVLLAAIEVAAYYAEHIKELDAA